jgi:hypothetical protein
MNCRWNQEGLTDTAQRRLYLTRRLYMADTSPLNDPSPREDTFPPVEQSGSPVSPQHGEYPPTPETTPPPRAAQQRHPAPEDAGAPGETTAVAQPFWTELTLLGQVAGVAGILLLIFFFLPWCFTPDVSAASTPITNRFPTTSHSGWSTASGAPLLGGATNFNLFPQLWLILLSALALIAVAVLLGRQRIGVRLAALLITIISLYALLLEILFLVQIDSFQGAINELAGGRLNQTLYGVSWGFWLALVATVVALGMGAYMLYQEHAPEGTRAPRAPRFPEGQQPYPTA